MRELEAVKLIGYLTRSKAIWTNPELLNLVEVAPSPSKAYTIVLQRTGSQKKAKAARWYACALRDCGDVSPGALVTVLQSPQGAEKLERLLTSTSLKHGTGRSDEMSKSKRSVEQLLRFVEPSVAPEIRSEAEVIEREKSRLASQAAQQNRAKVRDLAHDKNLFAESGKASELPETDRVELLGAVLVFLEEEVQQHLQTVRQEQERYAGDRWITTRDGLNWEESNVRIRITHLKEAARHGIFITGWQERVAAINEATHHYTSRFSDRPIQAERRWIQELASELDQLSGEVPDCITGKGLEFAPSSVGNGRKVYMNGEFVASLTDATFSEEASGNGIVAWLTRERIDYCTRRGAQVSWTIYAWKKGLDKPTNVFEDHAYDAERSLHVSAPIVTAEGKIKVGVSIDGESQTRELSL